MKRKGFALLLGIILTLICYPAFAQDTVTIQDSIYTLNKTEQTATLIAGKTGEDGTLTIPDTINTEGTDYTVNAIGPNAFTKDLKELTVGKNVTTFDEQAFEIKKDNTDETETMAATIKTTSDTDMFAFAGNHNLTVKNTDTPQTTALDEATATAETAETPETTVEQQQETPTDADNGDDGVTTQNFIDHTNEPWYGNFRYFVDSSNEIVITGYKGSESVVTIPSYIDGKKVNILADNAFTDNTTMKKVIIPGTVEWIRCTFTNCTALETVVLNEGLKVIDGHAFADCTNLKTINIPDSVRTIADDAFYNCPNIDITKLISDKMVKTDNGDYQKCESVVYTGTEYYNLAQQVLTLVNQKRAANGLSALTMDTTWTEKAMKRAAECDLICDHYGPNGSLYSGNGALLENIGSGQTTAQEVVNDWMNSGIHKKAILDADAKCIGIGVWKNSTDSYAAMNWVMDTSAYPATSTCNTTGTKNASQTIYYQKDYINPTIAISGNTTVNTGGTTQLTQTFQSSLRSYKAWTTVASWQSSDTSVATVDSSGKVTGKKAGTTTITATSGSSVATTTVTVQNASVTPTPTPTTPTPTTPTDTTQKVNYQTHVQDYGWQGYVNNGAVSGTQGQSKRLEGIHISLSNAEYSGHIRYKTHIQNIGWESNWNYDGNMSGTQGRALRLEAIQIELTDAMKDNYDVYYRVHSQNIGWMGWAKNGESSGSAGFSYRLEGI